MPSLLVVEDETTERTIYAGLLRNEGYEVFEASDGVDGMSKARTHQPDVIVSDIAMPNMDGFNFYKNLQKEGPELAAIPFIFLTARTDEEDQITGIRMGVDGYLTKPVKLDLLTATIKSRIGYHKRLMRLLESNYQKDKTLGTKKSESNGPTQTQNTFTLKRKDDRVSMHDLHVVGEATNTINQGFVIWDEDLKLVAWSSKCPDFWYYPGDILKVGMPMLDLLQHIAKHGAFGVGDPSELAQKELRRIKENRVDTDEEFRMLDNRIISVHRHAMDTGGHATTYTDITKRKQAEEARDEALREAKRANQVKIEFLAHVSHELRTPLNAIIGFSQIWMDEVFGPLQNSKYMEYAKDINNSGTHLLEIIADILDLSKIVSGDVKMNLENVSVDEVLSYCVQSLQQRAVSDDISLEYNITPAVSLLHADRRMLEQILLNISENALESTSKGGSVEINVEKLENGSTKFSVTDTGFGMSSKSISIALEPFGQVRDSVAVSHSGIGLGLPLSKQKVELHGGTFNIDSTIGAGTTVTIIFPPAMSVDSELDTMPPLPIASNS